jgi:hypothetical protein
VPHTYWRRYRKCLTFTREHLTGEALKAVNKFEKKRAELFIGWRYPGAPTNNRAGQAFRQAAASLTRSQTAFGAFYRRKRAHSVTTTGFSCNCP